MHFGHRAFSHQPIRQLNPAAHPLKRTHLPELRPACSHGFSPEPVAVFLLLWVVGGACALVAEPFRDTCVGSG